MLFGRKNIFALKGGKRRKYYCGVNEWKKIFVTVMKDGWPL